MGDHSWLPSSSVSDIAHQLNAVHAGHLIVCDNQGDVRVGFEHFKGLDTVGCLQHLKAVCGKETPDKHSK